jgi:hypothetical protein
MAIKIHPRPRDILSLLVYFDRLDKLKNYGTAKLTKGTCEYESATWRVILHSPDAYGDHPTSEPVQNLAFTTIISNPKVPVSLSFSHFKI